MEIHPEKIFHEAAVNGHVEVLRFLTTVPAIDFKPTDIRISNAFQEASKNGSLPILKFLNEFPAIDLPQRTKAFKNAVTHNHLEILQFLLSFPEIDPAMDSNLPLQIAIQNGFLEIVKYLISLPRTDLKKAHPDALKKAFPDALKKAVEAGFNEIVKLVSTALKEIIETDILESIFRIACRTGNLELVRFFGVDLRVDVTGNDNESFYLAAIGGYLEICRFLVGFEGVCKIM